jgi:cytochrome b
MKKQLIYDLPTRIFHWLFAGLFVTAFFIAKTIDDDSPAYSYHMLAGLLLSFTVVMRLVWGFIGTKYARFSSFALHPMDLIHYLNGIVRGEKRRWAGHNPASSWATIAMLILALGLALTGSLMANGQKESLEEIHELLANGFLMIVLLHVAGVVLHALRHRDGITFVMMDGQKTELDTKDSVSSSRPLTALLFVALVASFSIYLLKNYDAQNQSLQFFGSTLQLGESGEHKVNESHGNESDDD